MQNCFIRSCIIFLLLLHEGIFIYPLSVDIGIFLGSHKPETYCVFSLICCDIAFLLRLGLHGWFELKKETVLGDCVHS